VYIIVRARSLLFACVHFWIDAVVLAVLAIKNECERTSRAKIISYQALCLRIGKFFCAKSTTFTWLALARREVRAHCVVSLTPSVFKFESRGAATVLDTSSQSRRAPMHEHRGDCYDTPEVAVRALLEHIKLPRVIWEPACGTGNIVRVLRQAGHFVIATDLNDRGCPDSQSRIDFLLPNPRNNIGAIVTNPPFSLAQHFVEVALERAPLVVMLLRLAFIESERRSRILDGGMLARILVFAKRLPMMHRANYTGPKANSGMAFAWFVWSKNHFGPTMIERIRWEPSK
jgi:hypothetical protein